MQKKALELKPGTFFVIVVSIVLLRMYRVYPYILRNLFNLNLIVCFSICPFSSDFFPNFLVSLLFVCSIVSIIPMDLNLIAANLGWTISSVSIIIPT